MSLFQEEEEVEGEEVEGEEVEEEVEEVEEVEAEEVEEEFAANISSVPTERTQTPEEALELSIWSAFNTFNISVLRFCRKTSCY